MKRTHGSGHLYVKWGSYYGRWRGYDGRLVNKKIGKVQARGEKDGLTRAEAERGLRRLVEADASQAARSVSSSGPGPWTRPRTRFGNVSSSKASGLIPPQSRVDAARARLARTW